MVILAFIRHAASYMREPKVALKPTGLNVDKAFVAGEVHAHEEALVLLVEHHDIIGGI